MRVRVEENGASITCDLTECFPGPENHDDYQEALASLIAKGEYVGGGGAASAYVISVIEDMETLATEYRAWCEQQGLPHQDAMELLHEDITADQRLYLSRFIDRWAAAEVRDLSGRA